MLDNIIKLYPNLEKLIETDENVRSAVISAMENKYLSMHHLSIWQDSKGLYCTKLGGLKKTAKTRESLNRKIIEYYKNLGQNFYSVMQEQLDKKLETNKIGKGSYDKYISDYERYVKDSTLDKKCVSDITTREIKKFLEKCLAEGISKKNFSNLVSLLNVVFFYSDYADIDVCKIKKKMDISSKQYSKENHRATDVVWNDEEQERFLEYASHREDNIRILGMVFMLQTGLAISELVALKLKDIDLKKWYLTVNRIEIRYKLDGKTVYDISKEHTAKTETRLNTIVLEPPAIETLKKILKISTAKDPDDMIFGTLKSNNFNSTLRRTVLKDLSLSPRGLHSFRKTYATNLIDAGNKLSVVKEQMRHSDISTTLKFYYKSKYDLEQRRKELLTTA